MLVREALMMTADNAESPDNHRGWGRIDVEAALGYVSGAPGADGLALGGPRVWASPNPFSRATTISLGGFAGASEGAGVDGGAGEVAGGGRAGLSRELSWGPTVVEIFSPAGRLVRRFSLGGLPGALEWDGRDGRGALVAPGIYLVKVAGGASKEAAAKVVVSR
jgi:hypothetical protein